MIRKPAVADFAPLIPLGGLRPELRAMLLPYAGCKELAPGLSMRVDFTERAVYVVSGAVEVTAGDGTRSSFAAGPKGRFSLGEPQAGLTTVTALEPACVLSVDRSRLDTVLTWSELYPDGERPDTWLVPVLCSELLARLPAANVHALLRNAIARDLNSGVRIVSQGEPGDTYYMVVSGECAVTRDTQAGLSLVIASLIPGDSFGEEALLTGEARNASVEAGDDGATVLAISKTDFQTLISAPLIRSVDYSEPREGAVVIDVRSAEEFDHDGLKGARNVPLSDVRAACTRLDKHASHLVYCDTGRRAAAAAFLMTESGLSAAVLSGSRTAPATATEADIQAQVDAARATFEAALNRTAELESGFDPEKTDPRVRQRIDEARKTLEAATQQRQTLEQQLRGEQAERERAAAQLRVLRERVEAETHERLQAERQRLHESYQNAETHIVGLNTSLETLSESAAAEHQRIDAELAAAQAKVDEELASARAAYEREREASEQRAAEILATQSQHERKLVSESDARLRAERQRLEAAVARSVSELHDAERRLTAAEHERQLSRERAAASAARLREQHERDRADAARRMSDDASAEAAESAASVESLRLAMEQEVAEALKNEEHDIDRLAREARRQMDEIARRRRDAEARAAKDEEAEHNLLAEISGQLASTALGEAERAAGEDAYARSRREQVARALNSNMEDRQATRDALSRARAHLEKLRSQSDSGNKS